MILTLSPSRALRLAGLTIIFALLFVLACSGVAHAAEASAGTDSSIVPAPQPTLALPAVQFWTLVVGSLVPLATYLLNHYGPQVDEKIKALVLVVVSAIAGAIYPLVTSGDWAFDTAHLELVGSAVIAALFAHKLLWKPSGISKALGGGTNVQDDPAR